MPGFRRSIFVPSYSEAILMLRAREDKPMPALAFVNRKDDAQVYEYDRSDLEGLITAADRSIVAINEEAASESTSELERETLAFDFNEISTLRAVLGAIQAHEVPAS